MSLDERSTDESWDAAALKSKYRSLAANKEAYLAEIPAKISRSKFYETLFDQTLAEFHVYDNLSFGSSLDTRNSALESLAKFIGNDVPPPDKTYDLQRFFDHRANFAKNLIQSFQKA